ncbi:hypothetical protein UMZ34_25170 [Halopseudomonas pachastrellae]|nr:hypothetical protein UMZ34_25170 [Halopseudomonas pachastrellae]
MSELKDESIEQGTRKRAQYANAQRANLALNLEREDGGTLQILVEQDMRSTRKSRKFSKIPSWLSSPWHACLSVREPTRSLLVLLTRPGRNLCFSQGRALARAGV